MIRILRKEECPEAKALVRRVFDQFVAPDYTAEGSARFYGFLEQVGDTEGAFDPGEEFFGYFMGRELAGVLLMSNCEHIRLLYVAPEYQRRGVARALFNTARQDAVAARAEYITVNASRYGLPACERLGFLATGPEQEVGGILSTPMRYTLNIAFTLRPWGPSDAETIAPFANNIKIARNLGIAFPQPYTAEDARRYIARCMEAGEEQGLSRAIVVDGRPVGSIAVELGRGVSEKSAKIGFWLAEPYWGMGIMARAVREMSELAFSTYDIVRIHAEVFSENVAACRVLERAGFTFEGALRSAVYRNCRIMDAHVFALVREQFQPPSHLNATIEPARDHLADVRALFEEYAGMLDIMVYFESFDEELQNLPGQYAEPAGRLYLAYCEGEAIGCVALRPIDRERCELRRLYVRPAYRGMHMGRRLTERAIQDAKEIGYSQMLLDTLDMIQDSISLFHKLGFAETVPYSGDAKPGLVYMALDLRQ